MNDEWTSFDVFIIVLDNQSVFPDLSWSDTQSICSISMVIQFTVSWLGWSHAKSRELSGSSTTGVDNCLDILIDDSNFQSRSVNINKISKVSRSISRNSEWRSFHVFSIPKNMQFIGSSSQWGVSRLVDIVSELLYSNRNICFGSKKSCGDTSFFVDITSINDEFIVLFEYSSVKTISSDHYSIDLVIDTRTGRLFTESYSLVNKYCRIIRTVCDRWL
ncbi:hypothetical protein GCK72_023289 [Caenorhabditis remanei]|uniref:Endonuclease/exonuclease/phosphatase domain-containing protein n=1 Tax=Caenorhabditis remanei TaxID=31234 RepID=A0A6A5FWJ8_CAERE|nr:hypothetical protein GCK72_023289 [Caenorhabditis remanei]KAF1746831.1 hypothetical protein GCK72_023289 [Caenorhabditis remanei]